MLLQSLMTLPLVKETDVRNATELVSMKASEMGFDHIACGELALAVSEISQNVVRYAKRGEIYVDAQNNGKVIIVTIKDDGPGIENLNKAMQEGYSSLKTSLGIGLGVAKKSVDEFEIRTNQNEGTEVILKKFLPIPEEQIEYGVVSVADQRYSINGDVYLVKEYDGDKVLLAVIDGTGEGFRANSAALIVKEFISDNYRLPLEEIIYNCHEILLEADLDRGATIALAKVESGHVQYLGIGDTQAYTLKNEITTFNNFEGVVGLYQLPTLKSTRIKLEDNSHIILCTDGIRSGIKLDERSSDDPQDLASEIFNEYHRSYGDVTVLVAKHHKGL